MLWIDKYCPRSLDQLTVHPEITQKLTKLLSGDSSKLPHLLFYGPSGSGKKTRILTVLRTLFGKSVDQVKPVTYHLSQDSSHEVILCQSSHHMQLSCPDLGFKDRVIIQDVIKDLSSNTVSFFSKGPAFRVFVFQDADALSESAQAGLRRTLESHIRNTRVILHVHQLSNIILPLRSRCLCIRVPSPSTEEIVQVLHNICISECLTNQNITKNLLEKLAINSNQNLIRSILGLETLITRNILLEEKWKLPWENYVQQVAKKILTTQSPKAISECRDMIYDLLSCCIPPDIILRTLINELVDNNSLPRNLRSHIFHAGAHFSHTMQLGSKHVWHIEAFIAQVMAQVKAIEVGRQ